VTSGAHLAEKGHELAQHFQQHGTPIMVTRVRTRTHARTEAGGHRPAQVGGGVLAYTILGIDFNASTGAARGGGGWRRRVAARVRAARGGGEWRQPVAAAGGGGGWPVAVVATDAVRAATQAISNSSSSTRTTQACIPYKGGMPKGATERVERLVAPGRWGGPPGDPGEEVVRMASGNPLPVRLVLQPLLPPAPDMPVRLK
jgi:hypothetical protein